MTENHIHFDHVLSCSFGGNVGHDPHILYTLSAVQILALFDELSLLDVPKIVSYVASLQQSDGSFMGDKWGEIDTRFSYCAVSILSLLGELHSGAVDVQRAVDYISRWVCIALNTYFAAWFDFVPM